VVAVNRVDALPSCPDEIRVMRDEIAQLVNEIKQMAKPVRNRQWLLN
jgi:hypothetical protein